MPRDRQVDFLVFVIAQVNAIKGMLANRKYSFKGNGMKNKLIVKISCQSLEGIIIQRSDKRDATHHACIV